MRSTDYDQMPYVSLPISYTQPARLAATALLHGFVLPPADHARILELGCAAGGNIIPLAARFPRATFMGIDLSHRHVEDGRSRIAALGLRNIDIAEADVTTASFGSTTYDYIICHGVFSWVPPAARAAILALCGRHLASDGVAVISYNVLPGWHLRGVIRDICLRFSGTSASPAERVGLARDALANLAQRASAVSSYGRLIREEAAYIATLPASYIWGEFLAEYNQPMHFCEFHRLAEAHNLAYLCEATPAACASSPVAGGRSPERERAEQHADYVTGRPFRRSLLVKSATGPLSQVTQDYLDRLHFSAPRAGAPDPMPGEIASTLENREEIAAWIVRELSANGRGSRTLRQLAADAQANGVLGGNDEGIAIIRATLSRLIMADAVEISTLPLAIGGASSQRPRLWQVALAECASGQPWLTSLAHAPIPVPRRLQQLAAHLDGHNTRQELTALMGNAANPGGTGEGSPFEAESISDLAAMLAYLSRHALLAPDDERTGA